MTSYSAWKSAHTGATLWRSVARGHEQHVAPDGVLDLMWHRDRLVVAGPDSRSMTVATQPGAVTWGLRLPPGVAHALFGVPVDELTGQRVELSLLVPARNLPDRAVDSDPPGALERVYRALWAQTEPDPARLRLAASVDHAARAGVSVTASAVMHDIPERSLQRLCRNVFGYGPKSLMQIHRFQRALRLVHGGMSPSAAAAAAGYFDHPHFARECRRLTGRTPSELAAGTGRNP
ncbi:AraC family transcriptional regulator [Nocardia stercoris]|uniref:AraC family transcriptional regulator n=1 Tax=Nocardia stercoris TaxID=2483361 RepID=A0A3M2KWB7_9NOCA|nr:helix-turn-helix domain-containing protein [Nocardia stercoris]RMI27785.1 AraC family transcriptional regulator [Nocardia stercoris]